MARKKRVEEHENHERWLVSYADFITLLFAFFVVMYSISSVNEGKYRVLSDAMSSAFNNTPQSLTPVQFGERIRSAPTAHTDIRPSMLDPINLPAAIPLTPQTAPAPESLQTEQDKINMRKISDKIESAMGGLMKKGMIKLRRTDKWIEIEINSKVLFSSGKARLQGKAKPVLTGIAGILQDFKNSVRVEGFTDNVPINTFSFPSNWELSAARAASVVHLFSRHGVDPWRLAAIGYGAHRPIADNATAQGRARNRRVVVFILSEEAERLYEGGADEASRFKEAPVDVDLDAPVSASNDVSSAERQSILDSIRAPASSRPAFVNKEGE